MANCRGTNRAGNPCGRPPMKGAFVCASHGGKAPQVKAAAARRLAEEQARAALDAMSIEPVDDPLTELGKLAGQVVAWKDLLADKVHVLQEYRYSTEYNEAIRGEVILFERAMDRCAAVLGLIAKLNIDERLAAISETQAQMLEDALFAAFDAAGLTISDADTKEQITREFARHLAVVPDKVA